MVWTIFENLEKHRNVEKIIFQVVLSDAYYWSKIKFRVGNVLNIFMEYDQGWTGNLAYRAFSRLADALSGRYMFFLNI